MILRLLVRTVTLVLLLYALGYVAFAVMLPRPAADERTDAIVVLTGRSDRLDRGFELMERGLARRMLISGVARTVRPKELAAAYGVEERLFDCCIDLDRESFDTRSNADEVARWMERRRFRSMRLVTNDVHMPRARYEIGKRMGEDVPVVIDAVPTSPSLLTMFEEYNKYLIGRIADLAGI